MDKIKQIIALVAVLFSITACRSSKKVAESTVITDTTIVERTVTEHSVSVLSPRDTSTFKVPVIAIKDGYKAEKKGSKNARAILTVKDDTMSVECECDSQRIIGKYLSENKIITNKTNKVITRHVPVKYVPWWVKTLAWVGAVTTLYFIGRLIKKIA